MTLGRTTDVDKTRRAKVVRPTKEDCQQACRRLASCPYPALRRVLCFDEGAALVLEGRVGSFYLKQLAQELVRQACGHCEIRNQIDVD